MRAFEYVFPKDINRVPKILAEVGDKALLYAGGTDALVRMKERVHEPSVVINLKKIKELAEIKEDRKGLHIGAGAILADLLKNRKLTLYPGLVEAISSVGTIQLRNMGTLGGNLCQKPRCWYYRSHRFDCLRKGGDFCFAIFGDNKYHCIIGGDPCYIVHPSDIAPMLIALGAKIEILGPTGKDLIDVEDFYLLPQENPYEETILTKDQVVTKVLIPRSAKELKSHYVKFRERESFDFAMVSVAVAGKVEGESVSDFRIVYGGVAPKPWRALKAENALNGKTMTPAAIAQAADMEFAVAEPLTQNEYKVVLARNLLVRAIRELLET